MVSVFGFATWILYYYHFIIKSVIKPLAIFYGFKPRIQISRNAAQSAASNIIYRTKYDNSRIMQTCPCNVDPLKPHFYRVKLELTREYIFLIFALKLDCGSYEYPQSMF